MTSLSVIKMSIPDDPNLFFDNFEEYPGLLFTPGEKICYCAPIRTEINTNLYKIFKKECPNKARRKSQYIQSSLTSATKSGYKTSQTSIRSIYDNKTKITNPNIKNFNKDGNMFFDDIEYKEAYDSNKM